MTKKRRYSSTKRDKAAEETRRQILDAARVLFAEAGIDAVTIAAIGKQAGVAASTIYGLFKSKAGILQALMQATLFGDRFNTASAIMGGVTDAAVLVALTPRVSRAIYESESAELDVIRGASAFSAVLRDIEAEFERLRFEMQAERLERLFAQNKARAGLTLPEAQRIMWMYTSRDVYRMLVTEGGWSPDQYQAWLSGTLLEALVKQDARPLSQNL